MKSLLLKSKRGQFELNQLQSMVITLVVIGVVIGVGFNVLEKVQDNMGANTTAAWQGVNDTIAATQEIPGWLSLIIIVAIAGIILALIFRVIPTRQSGAPTY